MGKVSAKMIRVKKGSLISFRILYFFRKSYFSYPDILIREPI